MDIKASVCIIAYNVEKYIAQAMDSVLAQQTVFKFEVVIGEDCSQDSTRRIIADYQQRYPEVVRPVFREKNLGMVPNFAETVLECRGRYIAMLDGDDFWNSPVKLQRQVEFLDAHPECSGCYHNAFILNEENPRLTRLHHSRRQKSFIYLNDLAKGNPVCSGSMVFRAGLIGDFPEWYFDMPVQDWPLYVLNAQFGPVGYINEVMSTYRIHPVSYWNRQDRVKILEMNIHAAHKMNSGTNYSLDKGLNLAIANSHYKISKLLLARKDYEGARLHSKKAMNHLSGLRYLKALNVNLRSGLKCWWA